MLFVTVTFVAVGTAVLIRRRAEIAGRLSVAATTLLALLGAYVLSIPVMELIANPWRWPLGLAAAAAGAAGFVASGVIAVEHALAPLRARIRRRQEGPTVTDRLHDLAERKGPELAGVNVLAAMVATARRVAEVRVTGLAAEMTYYGLISLVPLATAIGASLGSLGRIIGEEQVEQIETTVVDAVTQIFAEQVAEDVLRPLVEGLLRQERTGVAVGSILVAMWLASRVFRAAVRALDDAYEVPRRRHFVLQTILGLGLAIGAVITFIVLVALIVVGPLFGSAGEIAERFGLGGAFEIAWGLLRWPAVAAVTVAYLTILYRYGPNAHARWSRCLPGAVFGAVALVAVAVGFGVYVHVAGPQAPEVGESQAEVVVVAAQIIGVVLVGVLWLWLSSIVILIGGVFNAEIDRQLSGRTDRSPRGPGGRGARARTRAAARRRIPPADGEMPRTRARGVMEV